MPFLVTEDKDFGELVFRLQMRHSGILLIRGSERTMEWPLVAKLIKENLDLLTGRFSVFSEHKLRIKE
jgi:predicted nuclease of predicted toxin-antitoxin system